jgi:hypothetical protein
MAAMFQSGSTDTGSRELAVFASLSAKFVFPAASAASAA